MHANLGERKRTDQRIAPRVGPTENHHLLHCHTTDRRSKLWAVQKMQWHRMSNYPREQATISMALAYLLLEREELTPRQISSVRGIA